MILAPPSSPDRFAEPRDDGVERAPSAIDSSFADHDIDCNHTSGSMRLPTLLLLISAPCALNAQNTVDEPANTVNLVIDGRAYSMEEGGAVDVTVGGTTVKASASIANTKHTRGGGVSFDYPRYYAYEHESSDGLERWALDGNNMVVTLMAMGAAVSTEDLTDGMKERFGKKNCTVSTTSIELGGRSLSGQRMNVTLAGTGLTIDVLELPQQDGGSNFLLIQDLVEEGGGVSDENRETLGLLQRTMKYE